MQCICMCIAWGGNFVCCISLTYAIGIYICLIIINLLLFIFIITTIILTIKSIIIIFYSLFFITIIVINFSIAYIIMISMVMIMIIIIIIFLILFLFSLLLLSLLLLWLLLLLILLSLLLLLINNDFRPIALKLIMLKVMTSCICNCWYSFLIKNGSINRGTQKSFMIGISGTLEHLESLMHAINHTRTKQKSFIVTSNDLKNAFGKVHHQLISIILKFHHLPP